MEWINQILIIIAILAIIYLIKISGFRLNKTRKLSLSRQHIVKSNYARIYVGSYVGGGTNEFERVIQHSYKIIKGRVRIKKLRPVRVQETTSESKFARLKTILLYPITDVAEIDIFDSRGITHLILYKLPKGAGRSRIYKQRL